MRGPRRVRSSSPLRRRRPRGHVADRPKLARHPQPHARATSRRRPPPGRAPSAAARRRRRTSPPAARRTRRAPRTASRASRRRRGRRSAGRARGTGWKASATIAAAIDDSAGVAFASDERADAAHDRRRRPTVKNAASDREHDGLADHDVDVVQAVLQDRDADPQRHGRVRDGRDRLRDDARAFRSAERPAMTARTRARRRPMNVAPPAAIHRSWCRSSASARRTRTNSDATEATTHATSRNNPARARTVCTALTFVAVSGGIAEPASTIATVEARETHRQRGDGRCPSGSRSSRCVPISPNGITQTAERTTAARGRSRGGTMRLQNPPITSICQPAGFRGRRSATISPTTENVTAGGRSVLLVTAEPDRHPPVGRSARRPGPGPSRARALASANIPHARRRASGLVHAPPSSG